MKNERITQIVETCLENDIYARNDDFVLMYDVCKALGVNMQNISAEKLLISHKKLGLPSYETISRARRKIQADGKFLAEEPVRRARREKELEFRLEYARG